jgi:excisionase family DNA binding protein
MTVEPWSTIEEVSTHLSVGRDTIYRWIARRGLPATRVGKVWRFKLSEVEQWMRAQGEEGTPDVTGKEGDQ